jgi:hypothetical protein
MAKPLAVSPLYLQTECLGYSLPPSQVDRGADLVAVAAGEQVSAAVVTGAGDQGGEPSGPPFEGCQTPVLCRERVIVCTYPDCLKKARG